MSGAHDLRGRCLLAPTHREVAAFPVLVAAQDRLLRPGLTQIVAPDPPADSPLRAALDTLERATDRFLERVVAA